MVSLIASNEMVNLLQQAKDVAEIRDASGNTIGFFAPTLADDSNIGQGFTTKQVFERLLALTKEEKTRIYLQNKIDVLTERDKCAAR